jgi:hypothetical protein
VVWEFGSVAQPWRRCSRAQASPIGLVRERVCSGSPCRHPQGQGARDSARHRRYAPVLSSGMPAPSVSKSRKWACARALPVAFAERLQILPCPDVVPSLLA